MPAPAASTSGPSWRPSAPGLGTRGRSLVLVVLLALIGGPLPSWASGVAVEGTDRLQVLLPAELEVVEYHNAGYRLSRHGQQVVVEVEVAPLESRSSFSLPAASRHPDPVETLARAVAGGETTHYGAVSRLLGWVSENIHYRLDRDASQEAEAVLARRSAYCTGVSRLSVALLRAVGIEAREVPGLVVGSGPGGQPQSYFHRWIEVYDPDRGWTFSDPLSSHHFVSASYLRLGGEMVAPALLAAVQFQERRNEVRVVDLYPGAAAGISGRKNHARQLAGAMQLQVAGGQEAVALLVGGGQRRRLALNGGFGTFVGLEPGPYHLRVMVPGQAPLDRRVELYGRVRSALFLTPVRPATLSAARSEGR